MITATKDGRLVSRQGHELKATVGNAGYLRVCVYEDGVATNYSVHRVVAQQHVPNPHELPCVHHIDHDRLNNSAANLEWCTHKQNSQHMVAAGRGFNHVPPRIFMRKAMLSLAARGLTQQEIAASLGCSQALVSRRLAA